MINNYHPNLAIEPVRWTLQHDDLVTVLFCEIYYHPFVLQKQLKETQKTFQQRIQQREKDLQRLREAVESHKVSLEKKSLSQSQFRLTDSVGESYF